MIVVWMLYALVAGFALAAGAWAAEALVGNRKRVVWTAALLTSVAAPVGLPLLTHAGGGPASEEVVRPVTRRSANPPVASISGRVRVGRAQLFSDLPSAFSGVDRLVIILWGCTSCLFAILLLFARRRSAREARNWKLREVAQLTTLVSENFGPAVVGFFPAQIVLPRWTLAMSIEDQNLIVRHEQEHVLAHDQGLILVALAALVLMPWNAALWFQLARLRAAIELDCDARVIRSAKNPASYARVLLVASSRQVARPSVALALVHPASSLMRRVEALTCRGRVSATRSIARAFVSLGCVATMGVIPMPVGVSRAIRELVQKPTERTTASSSETDAHGTRASTVSTSQLSQRPVSAMRSAPVSAAARNAAIYNRALTDHAIPLALSDLRDGTAPDATDALSRGIPERTLAELLPADGSRDRRGGGGGVLRRVSGEATPTAITGNTGATLSVAGMVVARDSVTTVVRPRPPE